MKKFFEEFREFAMRGNVMDLAVGVMIGGAFQGIVTSLTDNFLTPLLSLIGGGEGIKGMAINLPTGASIDFGAFLSAVVNFLLMALILFLVVKTVNRLSSIGKKKEEPAAPATKVCPFCKSEIDIEAVRCPHCTSQLSEE